MLGRFELNRFGIVGPRVEDVTVRGFRRVPRLVGVPVKGASVDDPPGIANPTDVTDVGEPWPAEGQRTDIFAFVVDDEIAVGLWGTQFLNLPEIVASDATDLEHRQVMPTDRRIDGMGIADFAVFVNDFPLLRYQVDTHE